MKTSVILDEYEQDIEDHLGAYPIHNAADEINLIRQAAINSLQKDTRINIRVNAGDLIKLKQIAKSHGLKYQTLIGSVLHKFTQQPHNEFFS